VLIFMFLFMLLLFTYSLPINNAKHAQMALTIKSLRRCRE